jgi:hypothetical protein
MGLTLSNDFTNTFRDEHRVIRDLLFDLIDAFERRDLADARSLLGSIAQRTGPHFRYEEESLYPSLVQIFGASYVDKLLGDHDGAIRAARRLVEIATGEDTDDHTIEEAVTHVRGILPHVSDCDGLSIFVERLPDDEIRSIFEARRRADQDALPLLDWATTIRGREL